VVQNTMKTNFNYLPLVSKNIIYKGYYAYVSIIRLAKYDHHYIYD